MTPLETGAVYHAGLCAKLAKQAVDQLGGKAALKQKPLLSRGFLCCVGKTVEALFPDLLNARPFAVTQLLGNEVKIFWVNPFLSQLKHNAGSSVTLATDTAHGFGVTLIGKKTFALKLIENFGELFGGLGKGAEFSFKFFSGIFPSSKGSNCPSPKGG
jgi:hypothetical protein